MTVAPEKSEETSDEVLVNFTFDEIVLGQTASLTRTLGQSEVDLFATISGASESGQADEDDEHPGQRVKRVMGHSLWGGTLISAVVGTRLPGPGTLLLGESLRFRGAVNIGDTITAKVKVTAKHLERRIIELDVVCYNQDGDDVITGSVEVIASEEKIRRQKRAPAQLRLEINNGHEQLLAKCAGMPPLRTAVVHPCDVSSLEGAIEAAQADLIVPVLVGPEAKIRAVAKEGRIDLAKAELVHAEHSHDAAEKAVALARDGNVKALMKGSLHTDELMGAVVRRSSGLRTERRISHGFIIMTARYPKALVITDAAINIYPTLEDKVDICQNAIDLALALGVEEPKVAVISAVETINPKIRSTLEAACLCKMAERGQITGGLVDGPLAFDNAINRESALLKGIKSPVAGQADILLVPDLEAGNMAAKQLAYMANAESAGIVLGARVPIILTSRADNARTRFSSCAVAVLMAAALEKKGKQVR